MDDEKKSKPDKTGPPEPSPEDIAGAQPDERPEPSQATGKGESKDQPAKESPAEKPKPPAKAAQPVKPGEESEPGKKPAEGPAEKPAKAAQPVKAEKESKSEEKPAEKPAKAAKPAAKRPVKKRPVRAKGPTYEDLDDEDELLKALRERFGEGIEGGQSFLEQKIYTVKSDVLYEVLIFLREEPGWNFDYLIDVTALDYKGDEKRFCIVYHLYAYPDGPLIRLKSRLDEDEVAPSVASIWETADWLEREIYDMFGIQFSGHPNLKRILLPEDWHGYPLRKDYDIKLQDQTWIRNHLRIRKVPG